MERPSWYKLLLAARRAAKKRGDGCFTTADLGSAAGIHGTSKSSAADIASAYCGKLVRWGYAKKFDKEPSAAGYQTTVYKLTTWGNNRPAPTHKVGMISDDEQEIAKVAANPKRPR